MKRSYDKSKFLEALTESPWISSASKKSGISRATVYRWMKDIPDFKRAVENAIKMGNSKIGEMAEMGLVKKINEGHFPAIKYYLDHTNSKYIPKRSIYIPPVSEHKHSRERCELCGRISISKEKEEEESNKKINEALSAIDSISIDI